MRPRESACLGTLLLSAAGIFLLVDITLLAATFTVLGLVFFAA